jgi:nitrite reductase (NO-forming)
MSSYTAGRIGSGKDSGERDVGLKVFAVFAGITIPVVMLLGLWMAISASQARDDAHRSATAASHLGAAQTAGSSSMPGMSMPASSSSAASATAGAVAMPSYAGIAPANADALAMAHAAYPALLPAAPVGAVANVRLNIEHSKVSIAPGIRYEAWTFGGTVPAPVIHVRLGQLVRVTLHNSSPMPHSVDFHAALVAPNVAFSDVMPGASKSFAFRAMTPGVFMYHCGTAPAFMHIANGMYGAIIVEPPNMPRADRQYVLVSGEWYLNNAGLGQAASLDMTKALNMTPDWVTWNGYAAQYKTHPLTAAPGETVRFWVVDAGPSLNTDFHVVGSILSRAWINADLVDAPQRDIQTAVVPAGGGGVFDITARRGIYPFVSHSFASVQMGEVGLLNVGNVKGTMNH